jgi:hypothetical protein
MRPQGSQLNDPSEDGLDTSFLKTTASYAYRALRADLVATSKQASIW